MKHKTGNSPKCYECKFCIVEEDVRTHQPITYCTCKEHLRQGINGKVIINPPERMQIDKNQCCRYWIDAESGHTRFEVLTGYKEPYDGTKVDFSVSQISLFAEMEK